MATLHSSRGGSDDRLPLLANEEDGLEELAIDVEFKGSRADGVRHGVSFSNAPSANAVASRRKKHYSGSEMIVAVFVVAFDTKKGLFQLLRSLCDACVCMP